MPALSQPLPLGLRQRLEPGHAVGSSGEDGDEGFHEFEILWVIVPSVATRGRSGH